MELDHLSTHTIPHVHMDPADSQLHPPQVLELAGGHGLADLGTCGVRVHAHRVQVRSLPEAVLGVSRTNGTVRSPEAAPFAVATEVPGVDAARRAKEVAHVVAGLQKALIHHREVVVSLGEKLGGLEVLELVHQFSTPGQRLTVPVPETATEVPPASDGTVITSTALSW